MKGHGLFSVMTTEVFTLESLKLKQFDCASDAVIIVMSALTEYNHMLVQIVLRMKVLEQHGKSLNKIYVDYEHIY